MDTNPYESPQSDPSAPYSPPPAPATAPTLPEGFRDRIVGLRVFGALKILMGGFCALMVPLMAVSLMMPGAGTGGARTLIPATLFYALVAVVFVWLGVGSILARRWARALTLVGSSIWLVCGALGLIWMAFIFPSITSQMAQQGQVPPAAIVTIYVIAGGMMGCMYFVLPGAFVLFYRSEHVKATCEFRNPQPSWTDRCPLPVLAVSLLLASFAVSMTSMSAYNCMVPVFGALVSGIPGAVVILAGVVVAAYLAFGTYRLRMHAWWGTLALYLVWLLSTVVTFSVVDMMEYYRRMGLPKEQLEMMPQMAAGMNILMTWGMGLFAAVLVGYMLYVRKYFTAVEPAAVVVF